MRMEINNRSYLTAWYRRLDGIALFLFAAGTGFLTGKNQLRAVGLFMAVAFFLANPRKFLRGLGWLRPVPPELLFYSAWVLWVFTTGPLVAVDLEYFWAGGHVLAQMFVMVWIVYGILKATRNGENAIFLGLILGAVVEFFLVVTGMQGMESLIEEPRRVERVMGLTHNPNCLGFLMVWATVATLVFWKSRKMNIFWKALSFMLIGFCAYVLLATGSRKSSIAFVFVLWAWATFALPEGVGRGLGRIAIPVVLGAMALWLFSTYGMELAANTPVSVRWQQMMEAGGGSIFQGFEHNVRYDMYVEGFKMFLHHPIFGVGLNNFGKYFYTGQYSHSDYMEPLATTGLVGFAFYQAFYVILFLRTRRLLKVVTDPGVRYKLKMILIGLGAIMVIGFGAPHYTSQAVFLLLLAFSVYTWNLQRQVSVARRQVGRSVPAPWAVYRGNPGVGSRGSLSDEEKV